MRPRKGTKVMYRDVNLWGVGIGEVLGDEPREPFNTSGFVCVRWPRWPDIPVVEWIENLKEVEP